MKNPRASHGNKALHHLVWTKTTKLLLRVEDNQMVIHYRKLDGEIVCHTEPASNLPNLDILCKELLQAPKIEKNSRYQDQEVGVW